MTSMITDRIGRHEVLLPINHNFNKICDIIGYFLNQNTRNSKFCFASSEKKSHLSARVMARTVQLLRHDAYCPIKAEIRAVDSQSDLNTNKIVVVVVAFVVIIMWHFGRFKLLTTSTKKVSAIHQKHEILYLLLGKLMRV